MKTETTKQNSIYCTTNCSILFIHSIAMSMRMRCMRLYFLYPGLFILDFFNFRFLIGKLHGNFQNFMNRFQG